LSRPFVALPAAAQTAAAAEATPSETSIKQQIQALAPSLEDYVSANMKSFDVPGLAIGIVAGDKLIYAKGFGVRTKGGAPVDMWDDRIVDLDSDFQMRDPWVTGEFRSIVTAATSPKRVDPGQG
jgi:CubicO group peptidase (beta-lactamase class C family)